MHCSGVFALYASEGNLSRASVQQTEKVDIDKELTWTKAELLRRLIGARVLRG